MAAKLTFMGAKGSAEPAAVLGFLDAAACLGSVPESGLLAEV